MSILQVVVLLYIYTALRQTCQTQNIIWALYFKLFTIVACTSKSLNNLYKLLNFIHYEYSK